MTQAFHIQATEDLNAFASFAGKPGFTADTVSCTPGRRSPGGPRFDVRSRRAAPVVALRAALAGHRRGGHRPLCAGRRGGLRVAEGGLPGSQPPRMHVALGSLDGNTWCSYRLVTRHEPAAGLFLERSSPLDWAGHFEASRFQPLARSFFSPTGRWNDCGARGKRKSLRTYQQAAHLRPVELGRLRSEVQRLLPLVLKSLPEQSAFHTAGRRGSSPRCTTAAPPSPPGLSLGG